MQGEHCVTVQVGVVTDTQHGLEVLIKPTHWKLVESIDAMGDMMKSTPVGHLRKFNDWDSGFMCVSSGHVAVSVHSDVPGALPVGGHILHLSRLFVSREPRTFIYVMTIPFSVLIWLAPSMHLINIGRTMA